MKTMHDKLRRMIGERIKENKKDLNTSVVEEGEGIIEKLLNKFICDIGQMEEDKHRRKEKQI